MLNWTLRLWHQWNSVLISISFWCDQETMFCSSETSKNGYQKNLKKLSFTSLINQESPLINQMFFFDWSNVLFRSIKWQSRINRVNLRLCDGFLQFFDQSRILFDRLNRNQDWIESSRNFEMDLLNISINQEIPSMDQMNCFLNFH